MSSGKKGDAHAPLQVPGWWPGATGKVRFPIDDSLATASKALSDHLASLETVMSGLQSDSLVTAEDLGNWDAGQEFATTVHAAHAHINAVYRDFRQQFAAAAQLLVDTGQNHQDAEDAATKAVRRLGGETPMTPDPRPTRQNTPSMD